VRPLAGLRLELGVDWDQWSVLKAIDVFPQDIYILNIPSIDRYKVPAMSIALNLRDTFTLRLGGEYTLAGFPLTLRAGYIFERGAARDEYTSVLAMDDDKHVITFGAGYAIRGWRLDLLFAQSFSATRVVDFGASQSMQVNPINPTGAAAIGGGSYSSSFSVLGVGVSKEF
jgi:long-chain fatty acid transport protein